MHYDLLIITNEKVPTHFLNGINYLVLSENDHLLSPFLTKKQDTFDYLIISNYQIISHFDVINDNQIIITNHYFQTSISHIFAIGKCNFSVKPLLEQWQTIINYIKNGE
ncbi:MAG: hypothetical protein AB7T03_02670 [Bacilli bacterium]